MDIMEKDAKYVAGTYGRFPVVIERGKGSVAYDADGKRYIDLEAGYGTNSFGFCDDEWLAAVTAQLGRVQHTSNLYYTSPCAELAELLSEKTGLAKTFFTNSGGEANECALKCARKYGTTVKGPDCYTIVTMKDSFHGRSFGAVTATGVEHYHDSFGPMVPGFVYTELNDCEGLREVVKANNVAAIMLEFVQGEGGVNVVAPEYVDTIRELAEENDILVIADEVQAGNGRTGKLYSYMHYDIEPDIVTTAKGLGSGLPIGACMFNAKTQSVLVPGDHGSTYGGNPVACAGALSVIGRIDDAFLAEVNKKAAYIKGELMGAENVAELTGLGLMIGIVPEKGSAADIVNECLKNGVLCITAGGNKVRLLPPLNIPDDLLAEATAVVKAAFAAQK